MQIHLKQGEIEAALRMFIASQGINLTGKIVAVDFTSGRKDNGLSAEITIEEAPSDRRLASGIEITVVNHTDTPATDVTSEDNIPAAKPASLFTK